MPRGGEEKLRPLDFELETLVPNRAHLYGARLLPGSEAASRLETKRTLSFHQDLESFHFDEMESSVSQGERESFRPNAQGGAVAGLELSAAFAWNTTSESFPRQLSHSLRISV